MFWGMVSVLLLWSSALQGLGACVSLFHDRPCYCSHGRICRKADVQDSIHRQAVPAETATFHVP